MVCKVLCCAKEEERKIAQAEEGNRSSCHCACERRRSPEKEEVKRNTRVIDIPIGGCWWLLVMKCKF